MPLKRTPPSTPTPGEQKKDISAPKQAGNSSENITHRHKRNQDVCPSFMEEIRSLLSASNAKSDAKFTALQSSMAEIIAQNAEIRESITFTSKQYDDMMGKLQQFETERKANRSYIQQLEDRVDNLERMLFSTKLEIRNIPKQRNENKDDLCSIVVGVTNILETPIERQSIKDVFRVNNTDSRPTSIIVEFSSTTTKENILKKVRQFNNKNKSNKLNTTHLKLEGPPKPIYISEKLAPKAQRIFYHARNFAKQNGYKYCWTAFGRVYLRQDDGKQQFLIKSEADLNNLQQVE